MSFRSNNTERKSDSKSQSPGSAKKVDIAQLKTIDLGNESASLPSLEKTLPKERAKQLRNRILQGGNVALIADTKKGDTGVVFDLSNSNVKKLLAGELHRQSTGPSTVALDQLSAFAGKPLKLMPMTSRMVVTPGPDGSPVINGQYPNPELVKPIHLAMFQMPEAPGQEQGQQTEARKDDSKGESPEVKPEKTVAQQLADLKEAKFSTEEIAKTLASINKSSDPQSKEVIGVFVKPAYYQGSNLVPDSIVLQPMRFVGAAGQGQFQVEITKGDAMKPADYERAREVLGVSEDFPLDTKFGLDLTDREITVRAKDQDSFGNGGLLFRERSNLGSPMTTLGFIRRTPPKEAPKESGK